MAHRHQSSAAVCQCGQTALELAGPPLFSATCYCTSCRTAGLQFERELGAPPTVNADGGVDYCLYRKDRVAIARGAEHLREYRLKPDSPTRRVVAACCGSPMVVDFTPGHWLTIYRGRLGAQAPEPEMRVMTSDKLDGVVLSNHIPAYSTRPPRFFIKLLATWAAMGFRRPKLDW